MSGLEVPAFTQRTIVVSSGRACSLVWRGDELIDWVAGGRAFLPDGTTRERYVRYSYRFDAAVASPSGTFAAIYETLGTKALLLRNGEIVRELNRSFYHADVYEYPICLFALPGGREVLAHCPDDYCDVVLEDAETGVRLSVPKTGERGSFFHSRLAASSCGRYLLSAGWVWHPVDVVLVWEPRPRTDGLFEFHEPDKGYQSDREIASAAFTASGEVTVWATKDSESFATEANDAHLGAGQLGIWDFTTNAWRTRVSVPQAVGTVMPVGDRYAVGFHEHPKVFDLQTGAVVHRWPDLHTGKQSSSIVHHLKPDERTPPLALDSVRKRFAVGIGQEVTVVQFE